MSCCKLRISSNVMDSVDSVGVLVFLALAGLLFLLDWFLVVEDWKRQERQHLGERAA